MLNEFGWHFNQEDIDEFVWEVRYLMDSSGDLDAEVLADMMKNDIEIYPS